MAEVDAITVDGGEIRAVRRVDADGVRGLAKDSLARRVFVTVGALKHGGGPVLCFDGIARIV